MNTKPKWQRARTTRASKVPGLVFWVPVGPPEHHPEECCTDVVTGRPWIAAAERFYYSNLTSGAERVWIRAAVVELRPEFATEVPMVAWEDAMAESRADQQAVLQ